MGLKAYSIPALVLGSDITALGVIRNLGRVKIPLHFIPTKNDFVSYSRWAHNLNLSLNEFPESQYFIEFLSKLPLQKAVLFPCSDSLLKVASNLNNQFSNNFPSVAPSPAALEYLVDKSKFAMILKENNLPHPRTFIIKDKDELDKMTDKLFSQSFFKPLNSQKFFRKFGEKAFSVNSKGEAIVLYDKIKSVGLDVLLQEYLPGPATNHYFIDGFLDKNGILRALFPRRRLRMFPPDFGNSTYLVSLSLDEVSPAINTLEELFSKIKFNGIFSAEFKNDERDGLFKILEVNARPWWYIDFAARSGVNVCQLAYNDAIGEEVKTIMNYSIGSRYVYPYYDFFAFLPKCRNQKTKIFTYLISWFFAKKPFFTWDDPFPALFIFINRLTSFISRRLSKYLKIT